MNNSESTPINSATTTPNSNSNSNSNSSSPSKEQKSSTSQPNSSPKNIGGDQKNETAKTDIVKENKDVTAR